MAGWGRTGRWFAVDHWDVVPDIITTAKGINSGYVPLGAMTVRDHVYDAIKDEFFAGGLTYSGHPLACASGVASVGIFREEGIVENSAAQGEYLRGALADLAGRHPSIGEVRGLGLFWGLELVRNRETREPLVPFNAGGDAAKPIDRDQQGLPGARALPVHPLERLRDHPAAEHHARGARRGPGDPRRRPHARGRALRRVTIYHEGNRHFHDRFDTRRLADRIDERFFPRAEIDDSDREFIEGCDMFFLATADAEGRPQCSYKGGMPGFVRVLDAKTIAFPNYDGNGMYLSAGNVLVNPQVGLLFISFEQRKRMRLNGVASHSEDDPLMAEYPEAQFVTRVEATQVFPNCPRYIHEYRLVNRSRFVPREECSTPVPAWKTREWARDVLRTEDPANAPGAEVVER